MEELGDHKETNEEMFQDLLNAVVSFDLLSTKLNRPVVLDFSKGSKASRDLKNRGEIDSFLYLFSNYVL